MTNKVRKEVESLIVELGLGCSVEEFANRVNWEFISKYQNLSEDFIREFADRVNWNLISRHQNLSEDFIREFSDRVDWALISGHQNLSEDFIREFSDKIDQELYYDIHRKKSYQQKYQEVKEYAEQHNLEFDGEFLYAFREHDKLGRGMFNKTTRYKPGHYYSDWHCDLRPNCSVSFGLGIYPEGNTKVKVSVEDWGVAVEDRDDNKARVWGFTVLS